MLNDQASVCVLCSCNTRIDYSFQTRYWNLALNRDNTHANARATGTWCQQVA